MPSSRSKVYTKRTHRERVGEGGREAEKERMREVPTSVCFGICSPNVTQTCVCSAGGRNCCCSFCCPLSFFFSCSLLPSFFSCCCCFCFFIISCSFSYFPSPPDAAVAPFSLPPPAPPSLTSLPGKRITEPSTRSLPRVLRAFLIRNVVRAAIHHARSSPSPPWPGLQATSTRKDAMSTRKTTPTLLPDLDCVSQSTDLAQSWQTSLPFPPSLSLSSPLRNA